MSEQEFRLRVADVAARVAGRSGIDPLSVERALAVTTDLRLERLPASIGWGLAAMAAATGWTCVALLLDGAPDVPGSSAPGFPSADAAGSAVWWLVAVAILLGLGSLACARLARAARSRRPERDRYEDAWARFALETWPRRPATPADTRSAGSYSRSEFVLAVRDGRPLERFERQPPTTRNP